MAISVGRRRRRRWPTAGRRDRARGSPTSSSAPATTRPPRWARSSPREHRDRVPVLRRRRPDEGARVVVVDGRDAARRHGFFLGCSLLDGVEPGMRAYDDEIFGPVLERRARRRPTTTRSRSSTRTRTATGSASSPATAAPPAASSARCRSGWSASTCRSPCRWPTTRSAAGRRRCSATATCTGPRASRFYTRRKVVTSRWPDPATSAVDLGFPQTR